MITENYVSLGIAQMLSEKGFDGEAHVRYDVMTVDKPWPHKSIPKPTIQSVMSWLRGKHHTFVEICIYPDEDSKVKYFFEIYRLDNLDIMFGVYDANIHSEDTNPNGFDTYEKACEEGIFYCLKNLI